MTNLLMTLRNRLVVSTLLFTLIGFLAVVVVFIQVLAQHSYDIKEQDLATQARQVAASIHRLYVDYRRGKAQEGPSDLQKQVDDISRLLGERIIILSPNGVRRVDSAVQTPFDKGSWVEVDLQALQRRQSVSRALKSRNAVLFQAPIRGTGTHRNGGAVLLVAKVGEVRPPLQSLLEIGAVLTATALLVWLVIGTYFTFAVFQPLFRITGATARMARGDYNVRVAVQGPEEIKRLAASFNAMAARVQETDRGQRDFVANVSHDLRTPLTMVSGFSQALLDGTAGPEEVESLAEVINLEAAKMQQLVEDLLQLTKLETGLLQLQRESVGTQGFVEAVVERVSRAAGPDAPVSIVNAVPASTPPIFADPARLERALQNLLDNALAYTPPGGSVTVSAREAERNAVEITVTDTGVGIAPEDLPRIFERFYRADPSRERQSGHSGLGLAIVREIVEAHGGRVGVESEVDKGTTFRVVIPRTTTAPRALPEAKGEIARR